MEVFTEITVSREVSLGIGDCCPEESLQQAPYRSNHECPAVRGAKGAGYLKTNEKWQILLTLPA